MAAAGCRRAELVRQVEPGSVDAVVAIGGDGTMYEALQASAWLPCEIEVAPPLTHGRSGRRRPAVVERGAWGSCVERKQRALRLPYAAAWWRVQGMLMRPDWDAMRHAPLAQIPCGSGNALAASVGMWTVHTAVHAVVKGQRRALDIASGKLPPRTAGPGATLEWARAVLGCCWVCMLLSAAPHAPSAARSAAPAVLQHERRCFSFLSINFGLITNLDIGTEHLRCVCVCVWWAGCGGDAGDGGVE